MDRTDETDHPLRLSFTFPGSASLGAFQAGAVSALGEVVEELRARGCHVEIDAVGGASAGSIVALLFAHSQLEGLNVAEFLRRAWVDEISVDTLRTEDADAPLGFDHLRDELAEFLSGSTGDADRDDASGRGRPIALHIGLTNLLGLTYDVETMDSTSEGITYVDWAQFQFDPEQGIDQLLEPSGRSPVDYVLASASHPGAFRPVAIDRSDQREHFEENGITNFPESGVLWFTDGGLVEAEPIGRVVQLARSTTDEAPGARLHLVIDPRSSDPSGAEIWRDPRAEPSWLSGLRRSLSILPTQALQDDLRGVAVVNERLDLVEQVVGELGPHLEDRRDDVVALARRHGVSTDGDPPDVADVLRALLAALGGVADKVPVRVEVISPLEVSRGRDEGVTDLLAGDIIGAFGGFLSREIRASDFDLGWASVRAWVEPGLSRNGVDDQVITSVCERLDSHPFTSQRRFEETDSGFGALGLGARLRLARLAARVGRILVAAAIPWSAVKRAGAAAVGRGSTDDDTDDDSDDG